MALGLSSVYGNRTPSRQRRQPQQGVMGLQPWQGGQTGMMSPAPRAIGGFAPARSMLPQGAMQGGPLGQRQPGQMGQQGQPGQLGLPGQMGQPSAQPGAGMSDPNDLRGYPKIHQYFDYLIGQGGKSGAFSPDYLRKFLRSRAIGTYGNQQRRGQTLSGMAGLDPMQQRAAMFQGQQDASGGLSSALNGADLQGAQGYQQMLMSLLGQRFQQDQRYQSEENARHDASGGGIGGFLGQIAGAAIPSIPWGGVGRAIGGAVRPRDNYNDPRYGWAG